MLKHWKASLAIAVGLFLIVPLRLLGQDVPIDPADPFAGLPEVLGVLLPIVIGFVTPFVVEGLQGAIGWLETLPALAKKGLVLVVAFVLTVITSFTGIVLPGNLEGFTPDVVSSVISMFIAFGWHKYKKTPGV